MTDQTGLAAEGGDAVRLVRAVLDGRDITAVVDGGDVVEIDLGWRDALEAMARGDATALLSATTSRRVPLDGVTLVAPLESDAVVYCVGLNYREHEAEASELVDEVRTVPIIFVKAPRAMTGPTDDLSLPTAISQQFDWEVELGVVIGRTAVDVAPEDAWDHIAGYTVVNDITARDVQKLHQQWHLGKNAPASTPMGPWVIERDAFDIPLDVEVTLLVNGVVKQHSSTALLIHTIPDLIALLSRTTTLRPGDVIATGTPAGVGFVRTPPEFLVDGDVVETVVGGVGTLRNVVRTPELTSDVVVGAAAGAAG